jgi:quercetin dioxygenase-like cupin family protein
MLRPWHQTLAVTAALAATTLAASPSFSHGTAEEQHLGVVVKQLESTTEQWDRTPLPDYPSGQPELHILKITVPAGVTLPWHHHPVINAAYVLKGQLQVELLNGASHVISAGESLVEVVNTVHRGHALPGSDVEVVVFYAGQPGTPITELIPDIDGALTR